MPKKDSVESELYSPRRAATLCNVTEQYVKRLVREGKIPNQNGQVRLTDVEWSLIISRARREVPRAAFEKWLDKQNDRRLSAQLEHAAIALLKRLPRARAERIVGPITYRVLMDVIRKEQKLFG